MAVFKIVASRILELGTRAEFEVEVSGDAIAVGKSFVVFDGKYPVRFTVLAVDPHPDQGTAGATLVCSGWLGSNGQFAGGIVDSYGATRHDQFHYPSADDGKAPG